LDLETIELVPAKLRLQTILVPVDFSRESMKALKYAIPFAEQFGAGLVLLNVVEPLAFADLSAFPLAMENERVMALCRKKLESLARQRTVPPGMIRKTLVRQGQAFQEIADAARTLRVDLIIISTHGYTGLKHVMLGSTAERVVRHAPCPVLVVRDRERDFV
jgi:nucleotide-binding universal stress UspA family protein